MADHSSIEWTDATWNPITGCTLVSEGCRYCYAARLAATRLAHLPSRAGLARVNAEGVAKFTGEVRFNREWLTQPLKWKRARTIFVCAHGDLFAEGVPDEWIDQVFAVMALAPQHTFQVLTKRPKRMREYLSAARAHPVGLEALGITLEAHAAGNSRVGEGIILKGDIAHLAVWPLPNVWLGTSIEDQAAADARVPELLATPAAVRFVSAEPLLGPIDLRRYLWVGEEGGLDFSYTPRKLLHWVIVGGESGARARPMHPDWARALRDQCLDADVPFFFKQWGEWAPAGAIIGPEDDVVTVLPDGQVREWDPEYPAARLTHPFMARMACLGKKLAGRRLDGEIWSVMPAPATRAAV